MLLKRLFTSNTRVKLMTVFLLNIDEEYFIRELTRKLDEQINSVRRELDNLKKLGLLKTKTKDRKKYYCVNKNFILVEELRSICLKALSSHDNIAKNLKEMGNIKLLVLSGQFVNKDTDSVDMLIVGNLDRQRLANYLNNELKTDRPVKFTMLSDEDYKYRLDCHDKFLQELTSDPLNRIAISSSIST